MINTNKQRFYDNIFFLIAGVIRKRHIYHIDVTENVANRMLIMVATNE